MGNLVVSNAHTPAYRRSGLKRKHGAPQVLEQELSTASDPPQPKLGGLCQGAHKFCTVRGIILAQCKHSPQPAATKANTRLTRTQEDARKAPGSLPLRMHGDETILSSANTQGNQCCSHEHRQCDKRSLQPARAKTSRLTRTQSVAQQIITIPVTKNTLPVTKTALLREYASKAHHL